VRVIKKPYKDKNSRLGLPMPSDRDWTEDFDHENGNYVNRCMYCYEYFSGHKRRPFCKICGKEKGFAK
jgi:hypothetical protein